MTTTLIFATMACGGIGAACRAALMDFIRPRMPFTFPWPTLIVNILACFLIGLVISQHLLPEIQTALCTGFMGGFSTMSTLCNDAMSLIRGKHYARFTGYMVATYAICLAACYVGLNL